MAADTVVSGEENGELRVTIRRGKKRGKGGGDQGLYSHGKGMAFMSPNRADLGERISGRSKEGEEHADVGDDVINPFFFSFYYSC